MKPLRQSAGFTWRAARVQIKRGNLIHLTYAYLALPGLLFLLGWLRFYYAAPLAVLLVVLLSRAAGKNEINAPPRPTAGAFLVCATVAGLWVATSGAGGIGHQNFDYVKHNIIFKALVFSEWPVTPGANISLVYTIGYYLPAAAVGKLFGWAAANAALFAWTWAGLTLTLLWFSHLAKKGGMGLRLAPLFVVLSGMDILVAMLYMPDIQLGRHIEWASGRLQYSSMTTLLYWVPQHCLPGWLGAALFMQLKNNAVFYRNAMALGAVLALWSFFAALGVALLILAWFCLNPRCVRAAWSPPAVLPRQAGGALLVSVVCLFIMSSNFHITKGFYTDFLWARGLVFMLAEFALVALAAYYLGAGGQRRLLVAVSVLLAILPFYKVGVHDMMTRASIPLLFVFWCIVMRAYADGDRPADAFAAKALKNFIVAAIVIGAVTPYMENYRVWNRFKISPPAAELVPDLEPGAYNGMHQYLGHRQSFFFRVLAAEARPPGG